MSEVNPGRLALISQCVTITSEILRIAGIMSSQGRSNRHETKAGFEGIGYLIGFSRTNGTNRTAVTFCLVMRP